MLLRLHNRSGRAMLLKTDKVDEALNITENKTNYITDIFFLKYCLELGLIICLPRNFFLNISKKKISKHPDRLVPEKCAFS